MISRSRLPKTLLVVALLTACTGTGGDDASESAAQNVAPAPDPTALNLVPTAVSSRSAGLIVALLPPPTGTNDGPSEVVAMSTRGDVRNRKAFARPVRQLLRVAAESSLVVVAMEPPTFNQLVESPGATNAVIYDADTNAVTPLALTNDTWEVVGTSTDASVLVLRGERSIVAVRPGSGLVTRLATADLSDEARLWLAPSGLELTVQDQGFIRHIATRSGISVETKTTDADGGAASAAHFGGYATTGTRSAFSITHGDGDRQTTVRSGLPLRDLNVAASTSAAVTNDGRHLIQFDETVTVVPIAAPTEDATQGGFALAGPVVQVAPSPSGESAVFVEQADGGIGYQLDISDGTILPIAELASTLAFPNQAGRRVWWFGGLLGDGPLVAVDTESGQRTAFDRSDVGFIGFPPDAVSPSGNHLVVTSLTRGSEGQLIVYGADGSVVGPFGSTGLTRALWAPNALAVLSLTQRGPTDDTSIARVIGLDGVDIADLGDVVTAVWVGL